MNSHADTGKLTAQENPDGFPDYSLSYAIMAFRILSGIDINKKILFGCLSCLSGMVDLVALFFIINYCYACCGILLFAGFARVFAACS